MSTRLEFNPQFVVQYPPNGELPLQSPVLPKVPEIFLANGKAFPILAASIFPKLDTRYGLLQIPGDYTEAMMSQLLLEHQRLFSLNKGESGYWEHGSTERSVAWKEYQLPNNLRLRILPVKNMSQLELAALVQTQASCYEAKATMGVFPSTRQVMSTNEKAQQRTKPVAYQAGHAYDGWLLGAMSAGWNADDMVVVLDAKEHSVNGGFAPIAGGVTRFGKESRSTLLEYDPKTDIPTLAALQLDNSKIETDVKTSLATVLQSDAACIGRLFSIGSIDEVTKRLGGDYSKYGYKLLLELVLYGLSFFPEYAEQQLGKNVALTVFDTHLASLVGFLDDVFGAEMIANDGSQFSVTQDVYKTPHAYHYDFWHREGEDPRKNFIRVLAIRSENARTGREKLMNEIIKEAEKDGKIEEIDPEHR